MWIIILLLAALAFYFINIKKTVSCNIKSDIACKMYNTRDIQTKCNSMCSELNPNYIFTGQHRQEDDTHICECDYPIESFTSDFTTYGEHPDILPDIIPTDISNRNQLENNKQQRYKSLIFGK